MFDPVVNQLVNYGVLFFYYVGEVCYFVCVWLSVVGLYLMVVVGWLGSFVVC